MKSIPKVLQRHVWQYASDDGPMVCECIRKQCAEMHCTVFLVIYFCSSCLLARVDGHSTKLHDKRAKFFNCLFEEAKKKLKMNFYLKKWNKKSHTSGTSIAFGGRFE